MTSKFRSMGFASFGLVALVLALSAGMGGCAGKKKAQDEVVPNSVNADENAMGDSDSGKAGGLKTVRFPYDSFVLTNEAKGVLNDNIAILKAKPNLNVQIEGHCDERGGIQYNIALGEKRANAVKKFIVDAGISGNRVSTISFGKERPINPGHDEAAWAENRRGNFVITSQ